MKTEKRPISAKRYRTSKQIHVNKYSKMTDEVRNAILLSLRAGAPLTVAAEAAGVSANTVHEWIRRGQGEDDRAASPRYVSFVQDVAKARSLACLQAVTVIRSAMGKTWQAAAWYLERVHPEHFALKTRTEITGKDGAPLIPSDADFSKMTDEELQALASGSATRTTRKS